MEVSHYSLQVGSYLVPPIGCCCGILTADLEAFDSFLSQVTVFLCMNENSTKLEEQKNLKTSKKLLINFSMFLYPCF